MSWPGLDSVTICPYAKLVSRQAQEVPFSLYIQNPCAPSMRTFLPVIPQSVLAIMFKTRSLWVVGILLFVGPVSAQRTSFNPRLGLSYIYRSNIDFVGVPERPGICSTPTSRSWGC